MMNEIIDTYKTIDSESEGLFKSKGSKFIAKAYPIIDEDEVKPIVDALKKEYHSARHYCYAWKLGLDEYRYRANDDGEPTGSAGLPILNQIKSHELTDVLVVVIRYFGGTLLGVSGLIQAYKEATKDAIDQATIVQKIIEKKIVIKFDYPQMNQIMRIVKDEELNVVETNYELSCELIVSVQLSRFKHVMDVLNEIYDIESKPIL